MAFDPDKYLAGSSSGFDPDAYLGIKNEQEKPSPGFFESLGNLDREGMRRALSETPYIGGVAKGLADLPMGAAQLLGNVVGLGDEVNKEVAQREAEYQAARAKRGGGSVDFGRIAGGVIGTLPAAAALPMLPRAGLNPGMANVGRGAAAGAGFSVLSPIADDEYWSNLLKQGTVGAVAGGAMSGIAAPLVKGGAQGIGWLRDVATGRTGEVQAGKLARAVAGDKLDEIIAANRAAPSNLTAGQAAADVDRDVWQALGKFAESKDTESFYRLLNDAQTAARDMGLKKVTPDLVEAVAERSRMKDINYGRAMALDAQRRANLGEVAQAQNTSQTGGLFPGARVSTPVPPQIAAIADDPVLQSAAEQVRRMGQVHGDPLTSLEGLHQIKLVLDSKFSKAGAPTSLQNFTDLNVTDAKRKLLGAIGGTENAPGVSPAYEQARRMYAEMSAPVDQATVLNAMRQKLTGPVGERPSAFMRTLGEGEQALLKKSTGMPRFEAGDLNKVLTPEQMKAVKDVEKELIRERNIQERAASGMQGGFQRILEDQGVKFRIPAFFDARATLLNNLIEKAETNMSKKTISALVEGMKSGKNANKMLSSLPTSERSAALQWIQANNQKMGLLGTSAISQNQ